jgi:hypothetical protein
MEPDPPPPRPEPEPDTQFHRCPAVNAPQAHHAVTQRPKTTLFGRGRLE